MGSFIVVITVPLLSYPFHSLYASEDVRVKYCPSVTAVELFYSMYPFCVGHPGWVYRMLISFPLHHSWKSFEMHSGPLLHLMFFSLPFSQITFPMSLSPFLPGKTSKPPGTQPPNRCHPLCSVYRTSFRTLEHRPQNPETMSYWARKGLF